MNQHIEKAQQYLATADDWGTAYPPQMTVSAIALLAIAEALLSVAKSMNAMELEDARIQRNAEEWERLTADEVGQ